MYERLNFDSSDHDESWSHFRLFKNDIYRLKNALRIPDFVHTYNRMAVDGVEALCIFLEFNSLADFEPAAVVNQVEPLRKLMETRNKLRDLMTKVDRSEELEDILEKVLSNSADLEQLASELDLGEKA